MSRKGRDVCMKNSALPHIPLFQGLSEHQLEQLSGLAFHRTVSRGRQVFFEGDKAVGFFILLSGRVKISKLSPEGKEQILHLIGPRRSFWRGAHVCRRILSGQCRSHGRHGAAILFPGTIHGTDRPSSGIGHEYARISGPAADSPDAARGKPVTQRGSRKAGGPISCI